MTISKDFAITLSGDNSNITIVGTKNTVVVYSTDPCFGNLVRIYKVLRRATEDNRMNVFNDIVRDIKDDKLGGFSLADLLPFANVGLELGLEVKVNESGTTVIERNANEIVSSAIQKLMDFFAEFSFEPNFRFINTFSHALHRSESEGIAYVCNYFSLTDNAEGDYISKKLVSPEFKKIMSELKLVEPTHKVNNRFKIYYGSQGTGKTTRAMEETEGRCVVCNNSMLPADLMEDFTFKEGNATFNHSELWNCMEKGLPLVLDEINLLPFESLRFLQTILDNKKSFIYKGQTVNIADGFSIIGTMNLKVNGSTFGLPEPLVDRGSELKQFKLTSAQLINSIL